LCCRGPAEPQASHRQVPHVNGFSEHRYLLVSTVELGESEGQVIDSTRGLRYRDIAAILLLNMQVSRTLPKTKVPIDFGTELYEWLRSRAYVERRPMAELVREAVGQYKHREEGQLRLPFNGGS
jgi:hypothetical protein